MSDMVYNFCAELSLLFGSIISINDYDVLYLLQDIRVIEDVCFNLNLSIDDDPNKKKDFE